MRKQKKNGSKSIMAMKQHSSSNTKQKLFKSSNSHGITLVALVVSIIVMLVLAGVSINAVVGDNGIITQAQNATYATSRAVLEEWLNQLYVENYDDFSEYDNKMEAFITSSKYSSYFYNPKTDSGVGALSYIVDSEGHALYLIKKSALPDDIKSQLAGGDAGDGSYSSYALLIDVYGVTSDLQVYYCSNGTDTILGVAKEELDIDNPLRTVFASGSSMATLLSTYDTDGDGDISAEEVRSVTSLTLTSSSGVSSLAELYNLTSLKELTLDGVTLSSLDGIQNVTSLTYLCFTNYGTTGSIGDYSQMSKLTKLKYLYLTYSNDSQVSSVFTAMKGVDYSSLQYLGVYDGVANVTTVDSLADLSSATKQAVNYLYLYNNSLTDIACVQNYVNVTVLYCYSNSITTLTPACSNMSNIATLYAYSNQLGVNESTTEKNSETDALACLVGKSKLKDLEIQSNKLIYTGYLSGFTSFSYLYLAGNTNLNTDDLVSIKRIYWASGVRSIDSKYTLYLNTDDVISYASLGLSDTDEEMTALSGNTDCIKLDLSNNSDLTNDTLQNILKTMTSMEALNLSGISNLVSLDFVKYMPNLKVLYVNGTSISDYSILDSHVSKLFALLVSDDADLSTCVTTINNMRSNRNTYFSNTLNFTNDTGGMGIFSKSAWLSLESCEGLTDFYSDYVCEFSNKFWVDLSNSTLTNLLVKRVRGVGFILPSSLTSVDVRYTDAYPVMLDGSLCTKITSITCSDFAVSKQSAFDGSIESFSTFPNLISLYLTRMTANFNLDVFEDVSFNYLTSLSIVCISDRRYLTDVSGLSGLSEQLTYLNITYPNSNCTDWSVLNKLTKLTSLIIEYSELDTLGFIADMSDLSSLTITGGKISSCVPLLGNTSLAYLDLSNNNIYPTSSTKDSEGNTVTYNNCEILANLNPSAGKGGQLTTLYLSGNEYLSDSDYAYVKQYTWSGGCDF